jgi:hypothetical protein
MLAMPARPSQNATTSSPFNHPYQSTEIVNREHRLKAKAAFTRGFLSAAKPSLERGLSLIRLATGKDSSKSLTKFSDYPEA